MSAVTITATEKARSDAARAELQDMLLSGTTGGGTIPGPLAGLSGVPSTAMDMYQEIVLATMRLITASVVLDSNAGTVPLTSSGFATKGGPLLCILQAGWSMTVAGAGGYTFAIDGVQKGSVQMVSNETSSHKSVTRALLVTGIATGSHTITFAYLNGNVTSDANDVLSALVVELPA